MAIMNYLRKIQHLLNFGSEPDGYTEHLLEKFPKIDLSKLKRAETAFANKDWSKAEALWEGLLDAYPPKARVRLAQIYATQGKQEKASQHLNQAIPLLEQIAADLPSMGGDRIGQHLRQATNQLQPGHAVVEVGSWLGSGTAHLALGLLENAPQHPFHVYDQWQASKTEIDKATNVGVNIKNGQDTLPLVQSFLDPFGLDIEFHKGDIQQIDWTGQEIGLYVDDAAKRPHLFIPILKTFAPHWVPNHTRLFLQDFYYYEKKPNEPGFKVQKSFIDNNPACFRLVADHVGNTSCGIFDYIAPLPDNAIDVLQQEYA